MRTQIKLAVGDRLWFQEEKQPYRIRARSDRFLVCTKPCNIFHTVLYAIVDMEKRIRGPENLIFGMGAETDEQCELMLHRIESKELDISTRHRIPLVITRAALQDREAPEVF